MDEALRRYYLQQLGLETWLRHSRSKNTTFKVLIVNDLNSSYDEGSKSLLLNMLQAIGLKEADVAMGSGSGRNAPVVLSLCQDPYRLKTLRGRVHYLGDRPLVVSHHPVRLLENPQDKKQAYDDLLLLQQALV